MDRNLLLGKIGTKPIIRIIMSVILISSVGCSSDSKDILTKQYQEKYQYNNEGRLTDIIGPGERKVTLKYNERGQLQSAINSDETRVYEYNCLGFLRSIRDNTGVTFFESDLYGRLKEMSYPQNERVTYEYNENGDLASVAWENKHFLKFLRDLMGNTVKLETPLGAFNIQYDYNKRIMQRGYPNGAISRFTYDPDGRPVLIQHTAPNGRVILKFKYSYDDAGLLKTVHEKSRNGELEISYTYDTYGQLLKAEYSDGRIYSYEYDVFGNRLKRVSPSGRATAVYDAHDQLKSLNGKSVRHDAAGNVSAIDTSAFSYNANDALIDDGICCYKYNALGLRVEASGKDGTTRFIHFIDDIPFVLAEKGETTKRYLWNDGQCVGQIEDENKALFFFEDHLGSIRCAIDTTGNIAGYAEYSPFGVPIKRIAEVRFGFAGEEQDEKGKVYLRARYYATEIGRFLSKDPVPPQLMDKIKQNRYAYAANSPGNYKDRDGRSATDFPKDLTGGFFRQNEVPVFQHTINSMVNKINSISNRVYSTMVNIDNHWGLRNNTGILGEGQIVSQFMYHNIPAMSYIALHHDAWLDSVQSLGLPIDPLYNVNTMIPAASVAIPHFILDVSLPNLKSSVNFISLLESRISSYPTQPTPTRLQATSPNVGGVYLDKAAEVIGNLGDIEGVSFDPTTNRIILFGKDADDVSLSPIRLDDLAAAYRSVFGNYSKEPGVTIDPDPKNPKAPQMIVRFFGGMENTHFGSVLFEADRLMKALSLGEDNITHKKIAAHVDGYYNMLDLSFSNLGGKYNKNLWSRFWLIPEKVIVRVSDDKKSITFPDTRIQVKTETMRWKNGKLVPAKGEKDEKAEYFAAHFTKFYDEYAQEFPVYLELKNMANIVGFFKWLKAAGINIDLEWLNKYDKVSKTPKTTSSLSVNSERRDSNGVEIVSIFGGTDLTVKNMYVKDDGTSSQYGQKAIRAVASIPGIATTTFVGKNKRTKRVVALPTSQTRAAGAKIIREQELELLTRSYCSFHNDAGEFGRSWVLDLPVLHISQPHRGKKEYVCVDNQKVIIQTFHLTSQFGIQDVNFEKYAVDQQYGSIAFLPDNRAEIRALYPDVKKTEYRIEYSDNRFDVFNAQGKIVHRQITPLVCHKYSYDKFGRLVAVSSIQPNNRIATVTLSYDEQGRIASAQAPKGMVRYNYNSKGNLIKVVTQEGTIEYTYNKLHLVTSLHINGNVMSEFEYDDFGRCLTQKDTNDNFLRTDITTSHGKIEITQVTGNKKITRLYDAGGRLLEARDSLGAKITLEYYELGSVKAMEYVNTFGDVTRVEYSPDNKHVKYKNAKGIVRAFLFDEFGRLKQIQSDSNALVNKEYLLTNRGWVELTETSETKAHTLFNADMKPVEQIITAKTPRAGQLVTKNGYSNDGRICRQIIRGLIDEERIYENGRLIKQTSGDERSSFSYDCEGRLSEIVSGKSRYNFSYDKNGLIKDIALRYGDLEEIYGFHNGQLTKRTIGKGLVDAFQYDNEGMLRGVKRSDGEHWDIQRNKKGITYMRNGVVQMEYVFDENGRLMKMLF